MTFEEAMEYALALPGTERSTSYRQPCVKANGNGFLFVGHEPQEAFALHVDKDAKPMLLEAHPETFFETAHYSGHPIVLVRFEGPDEDLVREMIGRAADRARAKLPPRPRRKS
jgi:hypothetical protein